MKRNLILTVFILVLGLQVYGQVESEFLNFDSASSSLDDNLFPSISYNSFGFVDDTCGLNDKTVDYSIDSNLNLVSPNGNEFWQVGKNPNIIWESNNLVSDIAIEYSANNGRSWNVIATVPSTTESYRWVIPNKVSRNCLVRLTSGSLIDSSDDVFEISNNTSVCAIVVIGSSTAEGLGASSIEKSWVYKYKNELFQKNTSLVVFNFGLGGLTTFNLLPTDSPTLLPAGVTIDVNRNITKALSYNPIAIILNLPSNDTYNGYSKQTQLTNFAEINVEAEKRSVPIWITTTQPRYFSNPLDVKTQRDVKKAILGRYTDRTIDFWTGISNANGTILSYLDSGDGTHVNDAGHNILLDRVLGENIDYLTCLRGTDIENKDGVKKMSIKRRSKLVGDKFNINFYSFNVGEVQVRLYNKLGRKIITKKGFYRFKEGSNKFKVRLRHAKPKVFYCIFDFKFNRETAVTKSYTLFVK
ncbi:SGNH/GDSL hydrolase family protein [Algibacter sp. L4_22]|uniref:SGNH/GDSL hydrolase family protein n=1 Tax=Algibacter sp. L4_22 TaxID=2942477 RepID=UPI00201B768B|nr:SGNH/GDSL hydrolase family protein [Algibacter sp. L4_22]MCL5127026.1 SGNH/GDSL hydrolase family protein [Algibacter sp. L4_22]